ncbi:MAG: type II toxin-antitoxin system VapC family toxin [Sporichthyaceae bacterium]
MKLLLDTHVLLWWLSDVQLNPEAVAAIAAAENEVWVSSASVWEMSIKAGLGKLDMPDDLSVQLRHHQFEVLPIGLAHALAVRSLPPHHSDPFDRLLVAQASLEGFTLVTRDQNLCRYEVAVLRA